MPEPHDTCVLALDASTAVTGCALVTFTDKGVPTLVAAFAFDAEEDLRDSPGPIRKMGADSQRVFRIRATEWRLVVWVSNLTHAVDAIAYEMPNRNWTAVVAGNQAIGAYLAAIWGAVGIVPLMPVNATTAKAQTIGGTFRATGQTAESLGEKTRMRRWVCEHVAGAAELLSRLPVPEQEAVSDAVAVAVAAYRAMQRPPKPAKPRRPRSPKGEVKP